MNSLPPGWPAASPFPASRRDSTGRGTPDFPSSAADRERGRFRESRIPGLDTVAVANDSGQPIDRDINYRLDELIFWMKGLYFGMVFAEMIPDVLDAGRID